MKNKNGFTLAELIIVMIVLGVLSTLAIPNLSNSIERSRVGEGIQILNALLSAQRTFFFENGTYTANLALLDVTIPPPANFQAPVVFNQATRVASIQRRPGGINYTICVSDTGVLSCSGAGCAVVNIAAGVCP